VKGQKELAGAESVPDFGNLDRCLLVFTGEHVNSDVYRELLRQHVVPLSLEDVSWQKKSLSADLVLVHTARTTQQLFAEFWLSGLAAIFAQLEPAGLHHLASSAGGSPGYLDSLCPSIAIECDLLAVEYIHKTCCSFYCRHLIIADKN
jgi:hypothetical protein